MIAPWAAAYVGIPYQIGGSAHAGADCWGVVSLAYREVFGIALPSYAAHYSSPDLGVLAVVVTDHLPASSWRPVPLAEVSPGDGLLFRIVGQPCHVGLYVGDGRFLHSLDPHQESCIERLASPRWARRLLGAYRYGA